jgi:hypothetical protein
MFIYFKRRPPLSQSFIGFRFPSHLKELLIKISGRDRARRPKAYRFALLQLK